MLEIGEATGSYATEMKDASSPSESLLSEFTPLKVLATADFCGVLTTLLPLWRAPGREQGMEASRPLVIP